MRRRLPVALAIGMTCALEPLTARGQAEPEPRPREQTALGELAKAWSERFERARGELDAGNFGAAYELFRRLGDEAIDDGDRRVAIELANVARAQLERTTGPRLPATAAPPIRTSEELSVLYATAFLYGMGTGAWFILEARPGSVPTAVLPFAGLTIASVGAVSVVDHQKPFEPGVPQSIAAGTWIGLGQGAWIVGFQQARASRVESQTGHDTSWDAPVAATVLWGGATTGAALGTLVGVTRKPSPGRVSYTLSLGIWSGALVALGSGAVLTGERRLETALLLGGAAYNAGILTGFASGPAVNPSLTRVRLVDLGGAAGGLIGAAAYLVSDRSDQRATFGATAGGAALGLGVAWWLTQGMSAGSTRADSAAYQPHFDYALVPTAGGAEIRAGYTM